MTVPNPGSPEALADGCRCPVLDNCHGAGIPIGDEGPVFWFSAECPLHWTGDWKHDEPRTKKDDV